MKKGEPHGERNPVYFVKLTEPETIDCIKVLLKQASVTFLSLKTSARVNLTFKS